VRIESPNSGRWAPGSVLVNLKGGALAYPVGRKDVPLREVVVANDELAGWLECLCVSEVHKLMWRKAEGAGYKLPGGRHSDRQTRSYEFTFPDVVAGPAVVRILAMLSCVEHAEPNGLISMQ
jgi:hypothetical protein